MTARFKLTPPTLSETEIHEQCAQTLNALLLEPAQWSCFPAGHVQLSPAQAARLTRAGLKPGWPDFLIVYQALVFGIEIKATGGHLSKTRIVTGKRGRRRLVEGQEDVFPRLKRAGMSIAVVHSRDEMLEVLRYYGLPLRAAVTQPQRSMLPVSGRAA